MRVILIHGLLATRVALAPLADFLGRAGHEPVLFGYSSIRGSVQQHADALRHELADHGACGRPLAVVAHSLGGLVARRALSPPLPARVVSAVFLATPHTGVASRWPARWVPRLVRDAIRGGGRVDANFDASEIGRVGVVIASRDRVVSAGSADWIGATARYLADCGHNELLVKRSVAAAVERFIRTGAFEEPLDLRP